MNYDQLETVKNHPPQALFEGMARSARHLLLPVLLLTINGCTTLPHDYARAETHMLEETEETLLGKTIAPLLAQHPGKSGFHLLPGGRDALAARIALIEAAQRSLDLQYYIWHDDLTGRALHNRLLHAADRGVRVRLLLDDLDTAGKDATLIALDVHPNIEIRLYNPFHNRNLRVLDFLTSPFRINHRMHNKSLIADNQTVILGGRNIGDEYFGASEGVAFGDLDVLGAGPVARDVSASFDRYWNSSWVVPLAALAEDNDEGDKYLAAFRQRSDLFLVEAEQSHFAEALKETQFLKYSTVDELPFAWSRWVLVSDAPGKVEAVKISKETHLAPRLKEAFDMATKDLIIISPYFVPGDALTAFLAEKVSSGVRVRILTNSLAANDVSLVHAGYMGYRVELLKGGVELYEFRPLAATMTKTKKKRSWGSSRASLHAKSFAFDETYIFVGSFNLDPRSIALNTELGVYFQGPEYAALFSRQFDEQILEVAYRVELLDGDLVWTARQDEGMIRFDHEPETGWWKRFTTGLLAIFVPESML